MISARVLFLPGAGGSAAFFRPLASRLTLPHQPERVFFGWPGFGENPPREDVRSLDDLVRLVTDAMDRPVDLVAQSMGGRIAMAAALACPDRVRRIVLTATSGGVDMARFGAADWRKGWRAEHPHAPSWLADDRADLSDRLGEIRAPVLLVFGDADPISPVAVGEHLASLLPHAELVVIRGGDHVLASERAEEIAPLVERHLAGATPD